LDVPKSANVKLAATVKTMRGFFMRGPEVLAPSSVPV
jgi:hypothetical protein